MTNLVLLGAAALVLLAACNKAPEPKTSTADPTPGSTPAVSAPPGGSVAQPASRVPPSDAAIPPSAPGGASSGNANSPTQANPSTLQKEQEQSGMPQSGQVNNHSVPETTGPAK